MWIGVDLDGTLATYRGWNNGAIGEPVAPMLERVKAWIAEGKTVKIFTARVGIEPGAYSLESKRFADEEFAAEQVQLIQDWCELHVGVRLDVTCKKDFGMTELWDDRAIQVVFNQGIPVGAQP